MSRLIPDAGNGSGGSSERFDSMLKSFSAGAEGDGLNEVVVVEDEEDVDEVVVVEVVVEEEEEK
ncbi:hypothetical protein H6P81_001492 [Aristolochia fimbriata]|uniref:Uncharacterized protein n=1 Tax=Aristolochia fimbriata TaxID=158543 RepID=A0AAV7F8P2_ARIFI|nr:hypothetical protein H6P81_001492 [Aristolochia fimbriata]